MNIEVRKPSQEELDQLGVTEWGIWTCEPSTFDWYYSDKETCYILEGKVSVKTDSETVEFKKGDLVVFPKGLSCDWTVIEKVKKYYKFG